MTAASSAASSGSVELRLPAWAPLGAAAAAIVAAAPCCLWVASNVRTTPALHSAALFVHLAALLVGFGAVLTVDWVALLWTLGRRRLVDVLDAAAHVTVPIWAGFSGLVFSGLFLEPDLTSRFTQVKLVAVLAIGLNGVVATGLHRSMVRKPSLRVVTLGMVCAAVSQLCWWTATLVGFISAH